MNVEKQRLSITMYNTMKKSIDKRIFDRIKTIKFFVEFKIMGSDTIYKVELLNLSAGGMCFLRNSIINSKDLLTIKFPFKTQKILLNGSIKRIEGREVAVEFTNNEDEMKKFVDTFNHEYPELTKAASKINSRLKIAEPEPSSDEDMNKLFDLDDE